VRIVYADPGLIVTPPNKKPNFTPGVEFEIDEDSLSSVRQSLAILRLPDYFIRSENKSVLFGATSTRYPTGNIYAMNIGKTNSDFMVAIEAENLNVLPGSYKVAIDLKGSKVGITRWVGPEATYFIAPKDENPDTQFNRRG
jgi:hypothetical protein